MKYILVISILFFISVSTAWACIPQVTPTISIEPSIEPSTEPTLEVSVEPTVPVITTEPTPTAGASAIENHVSDGRSDGLSSCPECTKAPVVPNAPPNTGRG